MTYSARFASFQRKMLSILSNLLTASPAIEEWINRIIIPADIRANEEFTRSSRVAKWLLSKPMNAVMILNANAPVQQEMGLLQSLIINIALVFLSKKQ
ncbi:hypothetical protein AVEN_2905-1 [Araneus ventricosus]|uniref:Uncharacterized protein n=1 Tax=Araneus ventricosus TaxID=182803 RepID=A0A4Y2KDP1_ARAVE|nr:hypothetical protein AVEN_2905-1 [Araneus ventricosus]